MARHARERIDCAVRRDDDVELAHRAGDVAHQEHSDPVRLQVLDGWNEVRDSQLGSVLLAS